MKWAIILIVIFGVICCACGWAIFPNHIETYNGKLAGAPSTSEIIFTDGTHVKLTVGPNYFPTPLKVGANYSVSVTVTNGGNIVFKSISELP